MLKFSISVVDESGIGRAGIGEGRTSLGERSFQFAPRTGDLIAIDARGDGTGGMVYEVVRTMAVGADRNPDIAGEIFATAVGEPGSDEVEHRVRS